jgi:16S rRNA (cytosine967-C5)-methyltransferase
MIAIISICFIIRESIKQKLEVYVKNYKGSINYRENTKVDPRELVFDMLLSILRDGEYSHVVMHEVLDTHDYLDSHQKAFIKRLCEGCIEEKIRLEYILNQFSKLPVSKMKPAIRVILFMGTYQILYMDSIPDSAACNEAVKLTQKRKFQALKGFVNGILRNIARNKENIEFPKPEENFIKYLSITYSMPQWIIEHWLKTYPKETVEVILKDMQKKHPVSIRIDENLNENEKNKLISDIKNKGIEIINHPYLNYAYTVKHTEGMQNVPGFSDGKVTVQDVSSMLVAEIANPKKGDLVLDVCAAPGGKAMHIATKMLGSGKVIARDLSQDKLKKMEENQTRMNLENIEFEIQDATKPDEKYLEKADIVVADVPCSGFGVMGKKRDIRYRIRKDDLRNLPILQKKIVTTASKYVKKGGCFIYSTCTINVQENEKIANWIEETLGFERESLNPFLCDELHSETSKEGYLQLLPGIHNADGFFIAKFRKSE